MKIDFEQIKASTNGVTREKVLEWLGVIAAIAYSILVASNTGNEVLGFIFLFISAILIGVWAFLCKHYGVLFLQFFYASAGVIGVIQWH